MTFFGGPPGCQFRPFLEPMPVTCYPLLGLFLRKSVFDIGYFGVQKPGFWGSPPETGVLGVWAGGPGEGPWDPCRGALDTPPGPWGTPGAPAGATRGPPGPKHLLKILNDY